MEIREVSLTGFGALAGERLAFAPGMTVVFGPNEAAKTTIHAAIYAALCGVRRGRGQPRREDAAFAAQYRPWSGAPWRVSAVLALADGREIEISQDLEGGVDCRAIDRAFGRDVSGEILYDGSPDASRWLGFDRQSFLATACVRQAEIAAVLAGATALQDELQRAAASAGRDETAAAALERLRAFFSEHIGLDRVNVTKPLRRAITGRDRARQALENATKARDQYLEALSILEQSQRDRDEALTELRFAEAVLARQASARCTQQLSRAEALAAKHPVAPTAAELDDELAGEVVGALAHWDAAPSTTSLSGRSADELEAELAQLPTEPEGDTTPAQAVVGAEARLSAAEGLLQQHRAQEPAALVSAATAEELRGLADELVAGPPELPVQAQQRAAELRTSLARERRTTRLPFAVAGAIALAGVVCAVAVSLVAGAVLVAVGIAIGLYAAWTGRQPPAVSSALAAAERLLSEHQRHTQETQITRGRATARATELGLQPDPALLRQHAVAVEAREQWERGERGLATNVAAERSALFRELGNRGVAVDEADGSGALEAYKRQCQTREAQHVLAAKRPPLQQRIDERRHAEADADRRREASDWLLGVAAKVGIVESDPALVARALRDWSDSQRLGRQQREEARAEWQELQLLLGVQSLDEIRDTATRAERDASDLEQGFDRAELDAYDPQLAEPRITALRAASAAAAQSASTQLGRVEQLERSVPSVADAEEGLAIAESELQRVRVLEETLNNAIRFLNAAQDRVHRDIAPRLRETLIRWLPRIAVQRRSDELTGRYDDVLVDPQSLKVSVRMRDGSLRDAEHLSEGTKEQILLLLRVALAEHLTVKGERTPLLLDEVTSQCDADRRIALLELLHELSSDRQVVLFTHDEGVQNWATSRFEGSSRDRLMVRQPVAVERA